MYEKRIARVMEALEKMGLEQMIVSDPDSIWYLTGYYVFPHERLFVLYLRKDGNHKFFLNKLFPVPQVDFEQVWFTDTDDYLTIMAENVDGTKPMGIDKDWAARFLLSLQGHHPNMKCVESSTVWTAYVPARTRWNRSLKRDFVIRTANTMVVVFGLAAWVKPLLVTAAEMLADFV